MMREEDYLGRIGNIIDEYRALENEDDDYEYDEYICIPCKIKNICSIPTNDIGPQEIYYLIDTLKEILISYGLLPDGSRLLEEETINVSDCTDRELISTLDNIIDKITGLMCDTALLG